MYRTNRCARCWPAGDCRFKVTRPKSPKARLRNSRPILLAGVDALVRLHEGRVSYNGSEWVLSGRAETATERDGILASLETAVDLGNWRLDIEASCHRRCRWRSLSLVVWSGPQTVALHSRAMSRPIRFAAFLSCGPVTSYPMKPSCGRCAWRFHRQFARRNGCFARP